MDPCSSSVFAETDWLVLVSAKVFWRPWCAFSRLSQVCVISCECIYTHAHAHARAQTHTHTCTHSHYMKWSESGKSSCGISEKEIGLQTGSPYIKNSRYTSWYILEYQGSDQHFQHSFGLLFPIMETDILPPPF